MATRYWSASADGTFTTAANWLDAAGAPSGGAPANSDTLVFNDGSVSVTGGLSGSLTGLTIVVLPTYSGSIGTLGSALVQTSFADIRCAGSGHYYKFSGTVTKFDVVVWTNSEFHLSGGTWGGTNELLRSGGGGRVIMDGSAVFASGTILYNAGSRWTVAAGTDTNRPTVINDQGSIAFARDFGNVHNGPLASFTATEDAGHGSGEVVHNYGAYYHWTTETDAVIHAHSRSRIVVRGTPALTPTITTLYRTGKAAIEEQRGGARLTITNDIPVGDVAAFSDNA